MFSIIGCQELEQGENTAQKEINSLLRSLEVACSSNNSEELTKIIANANRLRPSAKYQADSVQLLLATAKGKLAQLQLSEIYAQTHAIVAQFQLASQQSNRVASLRDASQAHALATEETGYDLTPDIEIAYEELQIVFSDQISDAMSLISQIEATNENTLREANRLREEAESLFNDADSAGIIDGHKSFKSAVKTIRKSQQIELEVNALSLQKDVLLQPSLENSRAEIEAVASILLSVEYTVELLQDLRNSSQDSASLLSRAADEIDNNAAATMDNAIDLSNNLRTQWNQSISLLQEAIQKSPRLRDAPQEMQKTSNLWKLNMEWQLGLAEESRKSFLMEQAQALLTMVNNGILSQSSKWVELERSTSDAANQSLNAAIAAYEKR